MSIEWIHANPNTVNKVFDDMSHQTTLKIALKITAQSKSLQVPNTGRLRNSIMWKVGNKEGGFNDSGGEPTDLFLTVMPENEADGFVGANCNYGVYEEFGTRYRKPKPFLRPAIALATTNQTAQEIKKMIEDENILGKLVDGQIRESFY